MNVVNVWLGLPISKKLISAASMVATIGLMYWLAVIATAPKLDLLYSGLDASAAGEVIAKLETMDVAYDVKGNAIYADSKRRDSLRLRLAREGLPQQSVVGYELFDNLNSFSMSADMFDTAYWRAKEGELARTILSLPNVKGARVHLGAQKTTGFGGRAKMKTASVTLATASGLSPQQAKAIQYLTALSVVGLDPVNVAIIDSKAGLIAGPGLNDTSTAPGGDELDRARKLKQDILHLLEARVGAGNARVNVMLEIDRKKQTSSERVFDPNGRVLRSQSIAETSGSSTGTNAAVTVASNLPEGAAGGQNSNEERQDSTETATYEISEVLRNTEILPGAIKRLSVAILLNDSAAVNANGQSEMVPRPDAELKALTELVTAAAGLDPERGDTITMKSMPFDQPSDGELLVRPGVFQTFLDTYLWSTVQSVIFGLFALLLGMLVIKPLLFQRGLVSDQHAGLLPMHMDGSEGDSLAVSDTQALGLPDGTVRARLGGPDTDDPIAHLENTAKTQVEDAAELLSNWLSEPEAAAQ